MTTKSDNNLIDHIKSNWLIYAFFVQIIVTWVTFNARLATAETNISELQSSYKEYQVSVLQINAKLSGLEAGVAGINANLEWLKAAHRN